MGEFSCSQVDLVSFLPVSPVGGGRGVRLSGVWGWTDPESGKEYALLGRMDGTSFVDVSDPANPLYLGDLPKTRARRARSGARSRSTGTTRSSWPTARALTGCRSST